MLIYGGNQEVVCLEKLFFINRIKEIHEDNIYCYGRRRMEKAHKKEGITFVIFKVARLMKEAGVVAKMPKNHITTHLEIKSQISLIY